MLIRHFSLSLLFCCCFFPFFLFCCFSFFSIQMMSHCDCVQRGLVQIRSEKLCVNSPVSQRAHWAAMRPLGLKFSTFDPWETLADNDAGEQCSPSLECPLRATAHWSDDLSWIHLPTGNEPLPSGLVQYLGKGRVTYSFWYRDLGHSCCLWIKCMLICVDMKVGWGDLKQNLVT